MYLFYVGGYNRILWLRLFQLSPLGALLVGSCFLSRPWCPFPSSIHRYTTSKPTVSIHNAFVRDISSSSSALLLLLLFVFNGGLPVLLRLVSNSRSQMIFLPQPLVWWNCRYCHSAILFLTFPLPQSCFRSLSAYFWLTAVAAVLPSLSVLLHLAHLTGHSLLFCELNVALITLLLKAPQLLPEVNNSSAWHSVV